MKFLLIPLALMLAFNKDLEKNGAVASAVLTIIPDSRTDAPPPK